MTTPTTLPPPPQQQSTTKSELAEHVTSLEKKLSDLKQNNKNLDNMTQNLGSRVYTLELKDMPHKIDEAVRENVKEAVQIALQAPLKERFRDLSKEDMKEMLHQRMFKSVDDQDPPPPLPDSDLSKRRRHDTGASGSLKPQAPQSSAWKKSDTRDAPSSSFKQQSGPHAEQPVKDIPIPDSTNISDLEDTDSVHLLKIKQRPKWLKPILDDERPATLEPAWTGDMRTFMKWYCQKLGKTKLTQADFEGQAYEVIDWANPEGDQVRIDISRPLPLSGPPGHVTIPG
ncbi:hypothetical protein Tco_0318568 [Tanacetum coccineum]